MHRFFPAVVKPLLDILKPKNVVEIGAARGAHTELMLTHVQAWDSHLHVIDVEPLLNNFILNSPNVTLYTESSLTTLPKIPDMDFVLVDGDHNYFTVMNELKLINVLRKGRDLPFLLFHDVHYPYARRDQYYQPELIPAAYRQPWEKLGVSKGSTTLLKEGGGNIGSNKAFTEGGKRNGVLAAIEDFISTLDEEYVFITIPVHNGLGLLCTGEQLRNNDLRMFLSGLYSGVRNYPRDRYDYKYKPAILKKRSQSGRTDLCSKTTVAISSAGDSDFIESTLRRVRYHSPENLEILIVHSGPGFDKIKHHAGLYNSKAVQISSDRVYHHVAMESARQIINSEYILYLDSDAFPFSDKWIDDFVEPLENGCCCVGPALDVCGDSTEQIKNIFGIDTKNILHPSCLAVRNDYLDAVNNSLPGNLFDVHRAPDGTPARSENGIVAYDVAWFITLYAQMNKSEMLGLDIKGRYYGTGTIYSDSVFHAWYNTRQNSYTDERMDDHLLNLFDISLQGLQCQQQLLLENEDAYFSGLIPDHFKSLKPGRWNRKMS